MDKFLRETLPNGYFVDVPAVQTKRMRAIRYKNNRSTERRLRFGLVRAGLRTWKLHPAGVTGKPDFLFPEPKLAIFVDGCFWHGCPRCRHNVNQNGAYWAAKIGKNQERDQATTEALRGNGFHVQRFWEHELNEDLQGCVDRVRSLLAFAQERIPNSCE